jgi:UPF0122 protein CKR_1296
MLIKDIKISILMDIYHPLLTEKQYDVLDMYFNLDYSLSEIAENESISRQGVLDIIKRSEQKLLEYEDKLGIMKKFEATEQAIKKIERLSKNAQNEREILAATAELRSAWEE